MADAVTDQPIQSDTNLSFDFNRGVGPQIMDGVRTGIDLAKDGAGWLSEKFAQADPTTQSWLKFGMGFVGASIATRIFAGVTGMNFLSNGIVNMVLAAAGGMLLSGMQFNGDHNEARTPDTERVATPDPAADQAAATRTLPTPGMGGP
jgi:hypothetical protein